MSRGFRREGCQRNLPEFLGCGVAETVAIERRETKSGAWHKREDNIDESG